VALFIPDSASYPYGKDWRNSNGFERWLVYNYWDYYRTYKNYSRREYFLQGVMDKFDLTDEEKAYLSFLVSLTYNNATAWFIFNLLPYPYNLNEVKKFWNKNKKQLVFTSDRIYVKINDAFPKIMEDYLKKTEGCQVCFMKSISDKDPATNWEKVMEKKRFYFYNWFAMILYLKNLNFTGVYPNKQTYVRFELSPSPLLGMKYVYNRKDLTVPQAKILVYKLQRDMNSRLPFKSTLEHIESNLCPYHKFYEGKRYVGYYIDRDLWEIYRMKKRFPNFDALTLLEARAKYVDERLLGENYGNYRIRSWAEKLYLKRGWIEPIYYGKRYK
jgi:hypothetical protein